MKIPLKNQFLNIKFVTTWREPKLEKLKKELSDYFDKNDIEGIKIEKFELKKDLLNYNITPRKPYFEGSLSRGKYGEEIKTIGNKYGIKNLGFIHWCYHK